MAGTKIEVDGETIEVVERDKKNVIVVSTPERDTDVDDIRSRIKAAQRAVDSATEQLEALTTERDALIIKRDALQSIVDDAESPLTP